MRFIFDIDDTLTIKTGKDYTIDSLPNIPMIQRIQKLYNQGHEIILYTARKMGSNNHCVGKAVAQGGYNTFKWLKKYKISYTEIYFGKPSGIIIDDMTVGYNEKKVFKYLDNIILNTSEISNE